MSEYDKQDRECEDMQKRHGPGGQLPYICDLTIRGQPNAQATKEPAHKPRESPAVSQKSDIQRVRDCALSILPYAAMSGVVLWWQQSGQLVSETGFWALIVIGILGAFKVGARWNG